MTLLPIICCLIIFVLWGYISIVFWTPAHLRFTIASCILTMLIATVFSVLLTISNHHILPCQEKMELQQHCILVAIPVDNFIKEN